VHENLERPTTDWSDDRLLEEYRALSAVRRENADQDKPDKASITEEILRRGLSLPDVPALPKSETVNWNGEAGAEDPGSGALPTAF
jgi:hypothetical protein